MKKKVIAKISILGNIVLHSQLLLMLEMFKNLPNSVKICFCNNSKSGRNKKRQHRIISGLLARHRNKEPRKLLRAFLEIAGQKFL